MYRTMFFIMLLAVTASAQSVRQVSQSQNGPSTYVTAEYKDVPLGAAIKDVARKAGVRVSFMNMVLDGASNVTASVNHLQIGDAFNQLLKGTSLRAVKVADGEWTVTRGQGTKSKSQGVIVGKVQDAKTGKGIAGASVSLDNDTHGVSSDENGSYRLPGVSTGSHIVTVRLVGYAKQTKSVTVGEETTVTVDFKLEPTASVLDQVVVTGTVVQSELKSVPNAITVITAKQIEERGITKIDQLFRGDVPGLFAQNQGSASGAFLDEVTMFSRGATALSALLSGGISTDPTTGVAFLTNPIKTYVDGIELADSKYLSQIDPKSIERIEILTGPQASTIYGSNAINGVMQIFTKRGSTVRPELNVSLLSGWVENNFSNARTPQHDYTVQLSGIEGSLSYNAGVSWNYVGPWTPAKQSTRTGGFGGARLSFPTRAGLVTSDITLRHTITQSLQRGHAEQTRTGYSEIGWWTVDNTFGLAQPTTYTLKGQTLGLTVSYAPAPFWSHELGWGSDASVAEQLRTGRGYISVSDTTLWLQQIHTTRRSLRYSTTARIPVASFGQATVTAGADAWQNLISNGTAEPQILIGSLIASTSVSRRPSHNTGGFLQTQIGVVDKLFLTYGLRMEWNPGFGNKARVIPGRYGVAYTQELGLLTAKLRGSYGRSTRPPVPTLKDALPNTNASRIALYGNFDARLANSELMPEHQQGGEGGLELYLGTRGSLVVTRYNQTVDHLIELVTGIDSVRSLAPCPTTCSSSSDFRDDEGHAFRYQSQNANIGSIRNQGWELQGSANVGPIATRGTYSWTKSRTIGVNPKYRALFANQPQYQLGASFPYLPEHTWALGITYSRSASSVGLNLTGMGRITNLRNDFFLQNLSPGIRLSQNRMRMAEGNYTNFNAGYALADLTASHRFAPRIEGVLQVQNLADRYENDFYAAFTSIGRQARFGLRVRTQ